MIRRYSTDGQIVCYTPSYSEYSKSRFMDILGDEDFKIENRAVTALLAVDAVPIPNTTTKPFPSSQATVDYQLP